jgi:hypothetical protein
MLRPETYLGRRPRTVEELRESKSAVQDLRILLYITAAYIGGLCVAVLLAHA